MSEEHSEDINISAPFDARADRRVFVLDDKRWIEFMAELAAPPESNPKLAKLLARKPVWKA